MAETPSSPYTTTDVVLAAYLTLEGFTSTMAKAEDRVRAGHPQGQWEFAARGDDLQRLTKCVRDYQSDDAWAEPKSLHEQVKATRREMFRFLGIRGRR